MNTTQLKREIMRLIQQKPVMNQYGQLSTRICRELGLDPRQDEASVVKVLYELTDERYIEPCVTGGVFNGYRLLKKEVYKDDKKKSHLVFGHEIPMSNPLVNTTEEKAVVTVNNGQIKNEESPMDELEQISFSQLVQCGHEILLALTTPSNPDRYCIPNATVYLVKELNISLPQLNISLLDAKRVHRALFLLGLRDDEAGRVQNRLRWIYPHKVTITKDDIEKLPSLKKKWEELLQSRGTLPCARRHKPCQINEKRCSACTTRIRDLCRVQWKEMWAAIRNPVSSSTVDNNPRKQSCESNQQAARDAVDREIKSLEEEKEFMQLRHEQKLHEMKLCHEQELQEIDQRIGKLHDALDTVTKAFSRTP